MGYYVTMSDVRNRWKNCGMLQSDNYQTPQQYDIVSNNSQWGTVNTHNIERQNQIRQQANVIERQNDYLVPTNIVNVGGAGYNGAPVQERLEDGTWVNVIPKQDNPYEMQIQPALVYVQPQESKEEKQKEKTDEIEVGKKNTQPVTYKAPTITSKPKKAPDEGLTYAEMRKRVQEKYKDVEETIPTYSNQPKQKIFGTFGAQRTVDPMLVMSVYNMVINKYQECFYNKFARMEDLVNYPAIQEFMNQTRYKDPINDVIYPMLTVYQTRCRYADDINKGLITENELNSYIRTILQATPNSFNEFRERTMLNQMACTINNTKKEMMKKENITLDNKEKYKKPLNSISKALGLNTFTTGINPATAPVQKNEAVRNAILNAKDFANNEDNELDMEGYRPSAADRGILEAKMKRLGHNIQPGNLISKTVNETGLDPTEDMPEGMIPPTYIPQTREEQQAVADEIINNMKNELHDYDYEDSEDVDITPQEQDQLKQQLMQEAIAKLPQGTQITPVIMNQIDKDVTKQMQSMGKYKTMNQFADNPYVTKQGVLDPGINTNTEEPANSYLFNKYKIDDGFWAVAEIQCKLLHQCLHNQKVGIMNPKTDIADMLENCFNIGVPFLNEAGQEKPASIIIMEYFNDLVLMGYLESLPPLPQISGGVSEYMDQGTLLKYGLPTQSVHFKGDYSTTQSVISNGVQMSNITNNIMNAFPMQQPVVNTGVPMMPYMPQIPPMQQQQFQMPMVNNGNYYRPVLPPYPQMGMMNNPYVMPGYLGGFRAPMYQNPMFNQMYNGYNQDILSLILHAESELSKPQYQMQNEFTNNLIKSSLEMNGMSEEEINKVISPVTQNNSKPKARPILSEEDIKKRNNIISQMQVDAHCRTLDAYTQYKQMKNEPMPTLVPSVSPDFAAYVRYVNDPNISYEEFATRVGEVRYAEALSDNQRRAKYEGARTFMDKKHINNRYRQGYNPIYADNMAAMSMTNSPFPTHLDPYKQYADPRSDEDIKRVIYSDAKDYKLSLRTEMPDNKKVADAIREAEKKQDDIIEEISEDVEEGKEYEEANSSDSTKGEEFSSRKIDNASDFKCLRRFGISVNEYEDFDEKVFDNMTGPSVYNVLDRQTMQEIEKALKHDPNPVRKIKKVREIINRRCPRLKYFNKGTNRFTFIDVLDNSYILKISNTDEGKNATKSEFKTQNILKPFCSKIFSITPDGLFSTCERVERYEKDAYSERFDDIKYVLQEVMSRCVVDDAGLLTFNNWGIREGFGPVILDYAKCYRLVDKYVRCNHINPDGKYCDGIMQFDTTFTYFRCPKCGQICSILDARGLEQIEYTSGDMQFLDYLSSRAMTDNKFFKKIKVVKGNKVLLDNSNKNEEKAPVRKTIHIPCKKVSMDEY